jgi:integrase
MVETGSRRPRLMGLHTVRSKGRTYVYAWRGGPCIWRGVGKPVIDPELLQKAYADRGGKSGTFGRLKADWRASPEWQAKAPATRAEWGKVLSGLPEKWDKLPLSFWEDPRARGFLADWRAKFAGTPRSADYRIQVLSGLFAWAKARGEMAANPADSVPKLYKGGQRADLIWEAAEIERWQAAPQGIRDAFNLARLTGLRRTDLCELPLSACGETAIIWKTSKSGRARVVRIPYTPELKALVAELRGRLRRPGVDALLVSAKGEARSAPGLTAHFDRTRDSLGLPAKRLHDCRGSYVTHLRLHGFSNEEIAKRVGWSVAQVDRLLTIYSDETRVVVAMGKRLTRKTPGKTKGGETC